MREVTATIEGIAPGLLMHRFGEAAQAGLMNPVKAAARSHDPAEKEMEMGLYRLEDGTLVQPGEHIYQAMVKTASQFQVQGQGKKTFKDAIKGGLLISPDYIPHEIDEVILDSRPVRIQRARIVRHRGLLPKWRLTFVMQLIDDSVPTEVVKAILDKAGQCQGIGDYRPRFGRFIVTSFQA